METQNANQPSADEESDIPERTCILTRTPWTPETLLRLALGPDNSVGPDYAAKLPGRGAWISLNRARLEAAIETGKFKGALAHGFKTGKTPLNVPETLAEMIEQGLAQRALSRLGLEMRSGNVVLGADSITELLGRLPDALVLHAGDAAPDGIRKLRTRGAEIILPVGRDALSVALGRGHVVHMAIPVRQAAQRIMIDIGRWVAYANKNSVEAPAHFVPDK